MISIFLFCILILSILYYTILVIRKKRGVYEYPLLAAITFLCYTAPDYFTLFTENALTDWDLARTILMALLCIWGSDIGFKYGKNTNYKSSFFTSDQKNNALTLFLALFFVIIGSTCFLKLLSLNVDLSNQAWEGLPVAYIQLSELCIYGFSISLIYIATYHSRLSPIAITTTLLSFPYLFYRCVIQGRRELLSVCFLSILLSLWFKYKKAIPVYIIISFFLFGMVYSANLHTYRMVTSKEKHISINSLLEINFKENFFSEFGERECTVNNMAHAMGAVVKTLDFDYGLYNWNYLIRRFFPRLIFGERLKSSFISEHGNIEHKIEKVYGYSSKIGSTFTGVSDAYCSFWYFGFIKFIIIGYFLGFFYKLSIKVFFWGRVFYVILLPSGMMAFTHSTNSFFNAIIQLSIFIMPLYIYYLYNLKQNTLFSQANHISNNNFKCL